MSNAQTAPQATAAAIAPGRIAPIASAFLFGLVLIYGTGFMTTPAVHNAAHDQRHAIGFPCH